MSGYEVKVFSSIGDATPELVELYAQGWRLVTVSTTFAVSLSDSSVNKSKDEALYIYSSEYFLEREKK